MANLIQNNGTQLIINSDSEVVTVIKYLGDKTGEEILLVANKEKIIYDFPQDGVYQIFQITVTTPYELQNNALLKAGLTIAEFDDNGDLIGEFNDNLLNQFIAESGTQISSKAICITDLEKCLNKMVLELMDKLMNGECSEKCGTELHTKRDLLWMAIIAIKYYASLGLVDEVQKIIESFACDYCLDSKLNKNKCNCHA